MQSLWSDDAAREAVKRYGGHGPDMALRVYTTRLLGGDPSLVLHGGGNTSVKTRMADLLGDEIEVLCVKGSGWDMGNIEPAGLPAVRRQPLLRLRRLDRLSDEDMVNQQRINLLDSAAPNPSVETLLHAFLPHKFIDHTHSTAVLSLIDQPDGEALARDLYGSRMGIVPYIMPGFALARTAAEVYEADPRVDGLILLKHGIFTFAETARDAYETMFALVDMSERRPWPLLWRRWWRRSCAACCLPRAGAGFSICGPARKSAAMSTGPTSPATASKGWSPRITPSAPRTGR